ncbi:hypothetical protein RJT34_11993 [Clitoria ternatea]|uniref:RING-type E3 ubiquitin transferase n=1 Tax=Clitoria ternatea TaxID=43366 RepID=A0AAN9JNJ9_CLITE
MAKEDVLEIEHTTLKLTSSMKIHIQEENNAKVSFTIKSVEVMRDPHVAVDVVTYEAEAIGGVWLESGHDTSPRTNSKLEHCNLVPNDALCHAI